MPCRPVSTPAATDALENLRGDVRRDQRLSDGRRLDSLHQILDRRVLEQVAARPGEDRVHQVSILVRDRQDDARGSAGRTGRSHVLPRCRSCPACSDPSRRRRERARGPAVSAVAPLGRLVRRCRAPCSSSRFRRPSGRGRGCPRARRAGCRGPKLSWWARPHRSPSCVLSSPIPASACL